jgi:hypothetical protein
MTLRHTVFEDLSRYALKTMTRFVAKMAEPIAMPVELQLLELKSNTMALVTIEVPVHFDSNQMQIDSMSYKT